MIDRATAKPTPKELAYRSNDGVEIVLLWHPRTNRLTVSVNDSRSGDSFELMVESRYALDAFNHPYAYAAFRGIEYATPSRQPVHA